MKKFTAILLSIIMVLSLAACGGEAVPEVTPEPTPEVVQTPEPTPEPTEEVPTLGDTAEKIVSLMAKHDYTAVMTYASDALKGLTTADYLYSMWEGVVGSLGDYEGINSDMTTMGKYMEYDTAAVFCEFSEGGVGVSLLFDTNGELDSILMNYYTPIDQYAFEGDGSATPLFWEVTSPDGAKMYMFGSYHLAGADFYPLPEEIMSAYEESDALAVEYDTLAATFDVESLLELQSTVIYSDGSIASDHLKPDTYQLAVDFMTEKGMYNTALESYTLSQWSSYLLQIACTELGFSSTYGVDSVLLNMAHHEGKKVLEVESQSEQLALLTSTSDLYNDASIRSTVEEFEEGKEYLLELFDAYAAGDIEALEELLLDDDFDEDDLSAYTVEEREAIMAEAEEYGRRMMEERNYGMAEKAEEYLASGETVFFVVGLAHMLGDEGLVQLLTDAGYTVERIEY